MMQIEMTDMWNPRPSAQPNESKAKKLLAKLRENGARGVTWDDFAPGFAIRSRISDLIKDNHRIAKRKEKLPGGCIRMRYILEE